MIAEGVEGAPTKAQVKEIVAELKAAAPFNKEKFYSIVKAWMAKYKIDPPPHAKKGWMRKMFKRTDKNGDGTVDKAEIEAALKGEE